MATIPSQFTPQSAIAPNRLPALIPRKRQPPPPNPLPAPQTPTLPPPPDLSTLTFQLPTRRILSPADHTLFLASPTHTLIISFVFSLSESCTDTKISQIAHTPLPPIIQHIHTILSSITALLTTHPPLDQGSSRFGNPAFRTFLDALTTHLPTYHTALNLPNPTASTPETSTYLAHAFGSAARIDYGSGHELNFILWLLSLNRLALLPRPLFPFIPLSIFPRYLTLLRRIQSTYYLEPAGSHGVWGLDDYHFLPFLFGAAQLLHHPYLRPRSIHNELVLEEEGDEYLYLDMVRYTMATKTVKGLKWTQPMLDDISGAKSWEKVEQGMRRMFVREVLGKLPIMQHFLFGSLIPAVEGMGPESEVGEDEEDEAGQRLDPGHVHRDNEGEDCCGIKIPSTIAASIEANRLGKGELRRVPFD